ncbi:calcium-binding protein [Yoonia sp. R2331]|uniref:calcium-binding protein n=1 Tax=Yoonia sp. R2331 TaxID=3237238 RepID=UPI0034E3C7B7
MPELITGTNTSISISDDIHRIVATTATVSGGITFSGSTSPGQLSVAGTVSSASGSSSDGLFLNGNDLITVTQTGSVYATDDGIVSTGAGNRVNVAGYVFGGDNGLFNFAADYEATITQTGVVQGGSNRQGTDTSIPFAAAVAMSQSGLATVHNHGTILADTNPTTGGTIAVLNATSSGISDNALGFNPTFESSLHFYNTGIVEGDILFAAGEDLYDGRGGGFVNGEIAMGSDDDIFRGGALAETAIGGGGEDLMIGGAGDDDLSGGGGNDDLRGGQGDDTLRGDNGNDSMRGNKGNDDIRGGSGNDNMRGGHGDDNMVGGGGSDVIFGDRGDDAMSGGTGGDTFVFRSGFGHDVISDFSDNNNEKINLRDVAAITGFGDLVNNHLTQDNGDAVITVGDNSIRLTGFAASALDAGDFLF